MRTWSGASGSIDNRQPIPRGGTAKLADPWDLVKQVPRPVAEASTYPPQPHKHKGSQNRFMSCGAQGT